MKSLKKLLSGRGISTFFMLAALICAFVALLIYVNTGVDQFSKELSGKVVAIWIVSVVLAVVFTVFEIKEGKYVVYVLSLWGWLSYFITQVNYIANLVADIDGNSVSATFVSIVLCGALAWIFALVSAIVQKKDFCPQLCKEKIAEEETAQ